MSRSSRVRLTRCDTLETTYGTPPSAAHTKVPRTDGRGSGDASVEASSRVRSDLKTVDVMRLDASGRLTINDEWTYEGHEEEIADALGNTWSTPLAIDGVTGDISTVAAGNQITSTTTDKFIDVVVGQAIRTYGFAASENNAVLRVTAKPDNETLTVTGSTLSDETPSGTDAKIRGSYNREGTTRRWVTFEELYEDLTDEFWSYSGQIAQLFQFGFQHPGRMTTVFEYMGQKPANATATVGDGTVNEFPDNGNRSMNSADHWSSVLEGGASFTPKIKSFEMRVGRGVTLEDGAGTLGPTSANYDSYAIEGSMSVRNSAAAATVAAKAATGSFTESSLEWQTVDPDNNAYHFYVPTLLFGNGVPGAGPKDSDVMIELPFIVARNAALDFMFQITKLPAAA